MSLLWIALIVLGGLLALLLLIALATGLLGLYVQALVSGVRVPMLTLIAMRLRGVDPRMVVQSLIRAKRAGLRISPEEVGPHAPGSGGDAEDGGPDA